MPSIFLTNITPEGILDEGHRAELSTYKGVMISNKQIAGVANSLRRMYDSAPGDVSGCYNSFSCI